MSASRAGPRTHAAAPLLVGATRRAGMRSAERLAAIAPAVWPPALFLAGLLALWAILTTRGIIPRYLLPTPAALWDEFALHGAVLVKHAAVTLREALSGFVLGNAAAIAGALLFAWSAPLRAAFLPLALASRAVPIVAVTPLLVTLLGRGTPPIIAVVAITAYFPTLLNMLRGLQSADGAYREMLHTLSATSWQRLRLIELPASLPYVFAALKVGASSAMIAAIVGEWIGSNIGLGYLIVLSGNYFKVPMLWAAVVTSAGLTVLLVGAVALAERLFARWAPVEAGP